MNDGYVNEEKRIERYGDIRAQHGEVGGRSLFGLGVEETCFSKEGPDVVDKDVMAEGNRAFTKTRTDEKVI